MAETEYRRLIDSAKERALFGFLAVIQRTIQDADRDVANLLTQAKSGTGRSALMAVRHFLRQDSNVFLRRVEALFRTALDRAMQTMYTDMRPGMRKLTADELTLVDDEVVNHQIEVGRLTARIREVNEENLGRLNVIIAQMHGHEVRERENPFRPYLLARALYEGVRESAGDDFKAKALFEHLSNAMLGHLPAFYMAIREVFESSGVRGKFVAQRSKAAHTRRHSGFQNTDIGSFMPSPASERVAPGLQRILDTLESAPSGNQSETPASVEDFLRKMFTSSKSFILSPHGEFAKARLTALTNQPNALVARLEHYQQAAAQSQPAGEQGAGKAASADSRLSALREHMDLGNASMMERMTFDVVAMLFEFILDDEQIPASLRHIIGRLQVPILKAALLEQELLHDEKHPARQLLNRVSSAALGADLDSAMGQALSSEIGRVVDEILAGFQDNTAIFIDSLQDFEAFLAQHLRQDDALIARGIDAVEEAEKFSVLLDTTTTALCDVLLPLNVDKRISDFAIHVWPHVLVQASARDAAQGVASTEADSDLEQFRAVLPELLWSIEKKEDEQERNALIRLLPGLVRRLRRGMDLIQLPDDESQPILDLLVAMHTQILRSSPRGGLPPRRLEDLRAEFARLNVNWERAAWTLAEPPRSRPSIIEEAFERQGIVAQLNLGVESVSASAADREFLSQTYLLGTRVAFRVEGEGERSGQLVWVSTHRSLYLFKYDEGSTVCVYTSASLLEALRNETIVPLEYAPVFERAVESLLYGAGNLQMGGA